MNTKTFGFKPNVIITSATKIPKDLENLNTDKMDKYEPPNFRIIFIVFKILLCLNIIKF